MEPKICGNCGDEVDWLDKDSGLCRDCWNNESIAQEYGGI